MHSDPPPSDVSRLAKMHLDADDPTGWFDELYRRAGAREDRVPWQQGAPHPRLVTWVEDAALDRPRTLVVGCGLGDDAEWLAARGFPVTAFDVSPRAVAWARRRHPESPVDYRVADLFSPPPGWAGAFDLVVEIRTLQALPSPARAAAFAPMAEFVAPGGRLFVLCRVRPPEAPDPGPPWALAPGEFDAFGAAGLTRVDPAELVAGPATESRLLEYRRPGAAPTGGTPP